MSRGCARTIGTTVVSAGLAGILVLTGCGSAGSDATGGDPTTGAPASSDPASSAPASNDPASNEAASATTGAGPASSDPVGDGTASSSGTATAAPGGTTPSGGSTAELPTATDLYTRMRVALTFADSVTFRTSLPTGSRTQSVTFSGNRDGTNASLVRDTDVETVEIRVVGTTAYLKGDRRYWEQDGAGAKAARLAGRWISAPTSEVDGQQTDMTTILDGAFKKQPTAADLARGRVELAEFEGMKAYKLTGFDGSDDSTLWIAAEGDAYPLRLTVDDVKAPTGPTDSASDPYGAAEMRFTAWDAAPKVTAPPSSQVTPYSRR